MWWHVRAATTAHATNHASTWDKHPHKQGRAVRPAHPAAPAAGSWPRRRHKYSTPRALGPHGSEVKWRSFSFLFLSPPSGAK